MELAPERGDITDVPGVEMLACSKLAVEYAEAVVPVSGSGERTELRARTSAGGTGLTPSKLARAGSMLTLTRRWSSGGNVSERFLLRRCVGSPARNVGVLGAVGAGDGASVMGEMGENTPGSWGTPLSELRRDNLPLFSACALSGSAEKELRRLLEPEAGPALFSRERADAGIGGTGGTASRSAGDASLVTE